MSNTGTGGTITFGTLSDGTLNISEFDSTNTLGTSDTKIPTQNAVKTYVDTQLTAQDLDFTGDKGGALAVDLDSQTFTFTGGTGVETTGSGQTLTFNLSKQQTTFNDVGAGTGTGSFQHLNGTGSMTENILTEDIDVVLNESVGNITNGSTISKGTSVESILRSMLIDYIQPTLNSFSINSFKNLEVGDEDTISAGSYTTGSDSLDSGFSSLVLTMTGNYDTNNTIASQTFNNGAIGFTSKTVMRNAGENAGSITITLTGTDQNGGTKTRTDSISVYHPIFWGGSSVEADSSDIDTKINSILVDLSGSMQSTSDWTSYSGITSNTSFGGNRTYGTGIPVISNASNTSLPSVKVRLESETADATKYTYIIYPKSFGALSSITLNDATPVLSAFSEIGDTVAHTRYGMATDYRVYRSSIKGAYNDGDTLTIED